MASKAKSRVATPRGRTAAKRATPTHDAIAERAYAIYEASAAMTGWQTSCGLSAS
jgi:hypothetical protein